MFLSPGHVVPRIAGGKVFIVAPDRAVTCLDLATGRQLWRDNSRKARETTGLGGDGRQFYYKTMDGELAAVDTSADAYRETWCTDLGWGYEYNSCPGLVCATVWSMSPGGSGRLPPCAKTARCCGV